MTLQDFKDKIAREQYCDNWKVFQMNCIIQGEFQRIDDSNDRAAELYAKEREEEAAILMKEVFDFMDEDRPRGSKKIMEKLHGYINRFDI